MNKRYQARKSNGRFTRNTIQNIFGLQVFACPHCGRFNTYGARESRPQICHNCNGPLIEVGDAISCHYTNDHGNTHIWVQGVVTGFNEYGGVCVKNQFGDDILGPERLRRLLPEEVPPHA